MCMARRGITITLRPRAVSQIHRVTCIGQVVLTFTLVEPIALMVFGADAVVASSKGMVGHALLYQWTETPLPQHQ